MELKEKPDIKVETIKMPPPHTNGKIVAKKYNEIKCNVTDQLIYFETFLRRTAYKNTLITTNESFFNNTDMQSDYYLVVVYEQKSNLPLLSCRYFFDKTLIAKYLRGDVKPGKETIYFNKKFNLENYPEGKIFLADRLSGNVNSTFYRQNRQHIFSQFYSEIVETNKNKTLLLMVRKDKLDKPLNRYLKLGFTVIGLTLHNGKEHYIILGELKK